MTADYTLRLADLAIIFATLLGPVLAVQAQKYLESRRAIEERRHKIFGLLMTTRAAQLSPAHVDAFNAIPVEFYGTSGRLKEINDAWKLYLDHHSITGPATEPWLQKRLDLFVELLFQISRQLGYSYSKAQLQNDIYSPVAHGELENDQTLIRKGLAKLLSGELVLPMAVREFPATADEVTIRNQTEMQTLLLEWLDGKRAVMINTANLAPSTAAKGSSKE